MGRCPAGVRCLRMIIKGMQERRLLDGGGPVEDSVMSGFSPSVF